MQTKSIGYPSLFSTMIPVRPIARRRTSLLARILRALLGTRFTPTQPPVTTSHSHSAGTRRYFLHRGASCFQRNFSLLNR